MEKFDPRLFQNIKAEVINKPSARTVTVSGEGKVVAHFDVAIFRFSLLTKADTVKEVMEKSAGKFDLIGEGFRKMKVRAEDMSVSRYNLRPDYVYPKNSAPKITHYNLDKEVVVKVRAMELVDLALAMITKQGVHTMTLIFDIDNPAFFKHQSREKALKDAHEKALNMAKVAGVRLGQVVTFFENEGDQSSGQNASGGPIGFSPVSGEDGAVAVLDVGSKEFFSSVSVTYEIE